MIKNIKNNKLGLFIGVLSVLASTTCVAWHGGAVSIGWGGGNLHVHGSERGGYGTS